MLVLWVVTMSGLVSRYQSFGGTYCPHLHGRECLKSNKIKLH
jgi:hypothetical protein